MTNIMEEQVLLNDEYEVVDFWRKNLPKGEFLFLPRLVKGLSHEHLLLLSDEEILCDCIKISREHLDEMTDAEVIDYINSQLHTIN